MDPELLRLLGLSQPTVDSIFSSVASPESPITRNESLIATGALGAFNPSTRAISMVSESAHRQMGSDPAETLAHEMTHQAATGATDPDIVGLMNMFSDSFKGAPLEAKTRAMEAYFGKGHIPRIVGDIAEYLGEQPSDSLTSSVISDLIDDRGVEFHEMLGSTMGRGFQLARRAQPDDPGFISPYVEQSDSIFPGTREAFNFFMRRFPRD